MSERSESDRQGLLGGPAEPEGREARAARGGSGIDVALAVMQALDGATTLGEAVPRVLRAIGEGLAMRSATYYSVVMEGGGLRAAASWSTTGTENVALAGERIAEGEGTIGEAFQSGKPAWHARPGGDGAMSGELLVPVGCGGRVFSVIALRHDRPEAPGRERMLLAALLGGQIGQFVERRRAEASQRLGEEWLATTLRSICDAVLVTDARGVVTFMNTVAEKLTGWPRAEAQGRPVGEIVRLLDEASRAPADSIVLEAPRGGHPKPEARGRLLIDRAGAELLVEAQRVPIRGQRGEPIGAVVVFRDARSKRIGDERRRLLAEAGALLPLSLDQSTTLTALARLAVPRIADWCMVDMLQPDGGFRRLAIAHADPVRCETAWANERRWPTRMDNATGTKEVLRSGRSRFVAELTDEVIAKSAQSPEHLAMLRALGLRSYLCVPLQARGRMLGAITFLYAESARRYDEEDLAFAEDLARHASLAIDNARLYHDAEEANHAKDEFLATVSHELRTPLTSILGWAQLLRGGRLAAPAVVGALEAVERNARALAKLIEDILDVSRIISGKLRIDRRPMDLVPSIEQAIEGVLPAAQARAIHLELAFAPSVGRISGDPDRLQQVVWNLLSNAIKFTPPGGRVVVALERSGPQVELSVRDTGKGIAADFIPFVFERFRQAEATMSRTVGGLGLGLGIARHLVELHGGTIRVESDGPGRGANFTVTLPLVDGAAAELDPRLLSARPPGASPLAGLRVLIVDDETDARELVCALLAERGALVSSAASAEEAMELLAGGQLDVLVSDLGMPNEDGFSLMRRVRALPSPRARDVPALALTAYARAEDCARALSAGFHEHLAKPVESAALIEAVARLGRRVGQSGEGTVL